MRTGGNLCFYDFDIILERPATSIRYFNSNGNFVINIQRHEQLGQDVFRLPEELRLDEITAEGRLVFKGEQSDEGRLLILEAN